MDSTGITFVVIRRFVEEEVVDDTTEKHEGREEVEVGNLNDDEILTDAKQQSEGYDKLNKDDIHEKYDKWAIEKLCDQIVDEERVKSQKD